MILYDKYDTHDGECVMSEDEYTVLLSKADYYTQEEPLIRIPMRNGGWVKC